MFEDVYTYLSLKLLILTFLFQENFIQAYLITCHKQGDVGLCKEVVVCVCVCVLIALRKDGQLWRHLLCQALHVLCAYNPMGQAALL